ncbi:fumarylacetoacetate hydrolase family protein [Halobacillus yeomjeoni]|uniref:Fumarylacetoacetate hydrolase family protein n=1 Tax=Halobacillus yeomjeoni TaxID=311194 RepID=A0A931HTB5_9BACI|nr:fumarylacetoacetate hydrolase family protein [Halobacillus yeomjeoni]MBH0229370.1 fumarylacetoacetate hydrolase family protein [Halobacillus yeomjeoni]
MPNARANFGGTRQNSVIQLDAGEVLSEESQIEEDICNPPVTGMVYGTLLNYKGVLEQMWDELHEPPYKAPPKAPILYIKPENTYLGHKGIIPLPEDADEVVIGASIGIVIGKKAARIKKEEALDYVEGYTVVNDVSLPHKSVFRPAVKEKARNGFCPIGPWVIEKTAVPDINDVDIRVYINGQLEQHNTTRNLVRSVEELLQDVTEFMTLNEGDVLMAGVPENPPAAENNDNIRIEVENIGVLENRIQKKV